MSRAQLTSTVEQNSAGAASPFLAGKNKIINGDFGVWQRGTSFSANNSYTADRWYTNWDGTGATRAFSQQTFTPGTAPVNGYESTYFYRFNQSVAGSGGTYNVLLQKIEDVRIFANQTVTISFWAKAAANITMPSVAVGQDFGSGGSGAVYTTAGSNFALTTSWQRFTATVLFPSISGKTIGTGSNLGLFLYMPLNTTFTVDVWGIQLEAGSVATPFTTASGTVQGELALCQRYYSKSYPQSATPGTTSLSNVNGYFAPVTYANPGDGRLTISFPQIMRTAPTIIVYSPNSGTTAKWFNEASATDVNAATQQIEDGRFTVYINGGTVNVKTYLYIHYTANAEL
jgi:hypothetical protein